MLKRSRIIRTTLFLSLVLNVLFIYYFRLNIIRVIRPYVKKFIPDKETSPVNKGIQFYDGLNFHIAGKYHKEQNYQRLPDSHKELVGEPLWSLSKYSTGLQIKFRTNSSSVHARWNILNESFVMNMTGFGMRGLDLYCYVDGKWQYVNSGSANQKINESMLISNMVPGYKDFLIYLPVYDEVSKIEIGIDNNSKLLPPSAHVIEQGNPIVFYGTSITHGEGASRPGMIYPSIISRELNIEVINFGFSGNGFFEESIGKIICEIPAQLIVLDCTHNPSPEVIQENATKLIQQLRSCFPQTPILLLESIMRENAYLNLTDYKIPGSFHFVQAQNKELRKVYEHALETGVQNLYYMTESELSAEDHEGSVDGVHLSDLGQFRIATKIEKKISEILNLNQTEKSVVR